MLSHVPFFAPPWTVARQAPLSMEFSRQEYWCEFPSPSPGDLPDPEIEPRSPALQVDSLPSESPGKPVIIRALFYSCPPATGDLLNTSSSRCGRSLYTFVRLSCFGYFLRQKHLNVFGTGNGSIFLKVDDKGST